MKEIVRDGMALFGMVHAVLDLAALGLLCWAPWHKVMSDWPENPWRRD